MTNDYTNRLLNEFDRMFEELTGESPAAEIMPFPAEAGSADTLYSTRGLTGDVSPTTGFSFQPSERFEVSATTPCSLPAAGGALGVSCRTSKGSEQGSTHTEPTDAAEQLQRIAEVTNRISAQRFNANAHIDILLADLIDSILQILFGNAADDDFFKLLNEERKVKLDDALTEFDFYNDNPYKTKAEKYLAKIEAKKNRR